MSQQKGELLELVLVELLKDLGFQQIRRQQSGTQFGFDVIACKTSATDGRNEVWKFECKNLTGRVTLNDIAPKLIWHFGQITIDHFVIVSPSEINNDLAFLLEKHPFPMNISLWTGEVLENLINQSPNAKKCLGIYDLTSEKIPIEIERIPFYAPEHFTLDVFHELDPPFSFDYIKLDDEVLKAYTEHAFRLIVNIANLTTKPLLIKSLNVVTLNYQNVTGRILRLHKAKGIFQPRAITFVPSQIRGSKKSILGKSVWQIDGGTAEAIALIMPEDTSAGLYHIMFSAAALVKGVQVIRNSPQFIIHIPERDGDILRLQVNTRHYESPVSTILNLSYENWSKLKECKKKDNFITFLGPTFHESIHGYSDLNWTVRSCQAIPRDDGITLDIDPSVPSKLVMDLGIEVEEELYCGIKGILNHLTEAVTWKDIIPTQIKRRADSIDKL